MHYLVLFQKVILFLHIDKISTRFQELFLCNLYHYLYLQLINIEREEKYLKKAFRPSFFHTYFIHCRTETSGFPSTLTCDCIKTLILSRGAVLVLDTTPATHPDNNTLIVAYLALICFLFLSSIYFKLFSNQYFLKGGVFVLKCYQSIFTLLLLYRQDYPLIKWSKTQWERWINAPQLSKPIANTPFILIKAPLSTRYNLF